MLHTSDTRAMHAGFRADFAAIKEVGEQLGAEARADVGESTEVI